VTLEIALLLGQDGLVNGAIYALLALALVLLFSVTRITFIPQGEFVAYGGLTLAALQAGKVPGTFSLLVVASALVAALDGWAAIRARSRSGLLRVVGWNVAYPAALWGLLRFTSFGTWPAPLQIALDCAPLQRRVHGDRLTSAFAEARQRRVVDLQLRDLADDRQFERLRHPRHRTPVATAGLVPVAAVLDALPVRVRLGAYGTSAGAPQDLGQ
jgi:hypothetical protein